MTLEHLMPESKELFKRTDGDMSKGHTGASLKGVYWTNPGQVGHQNNKNSKDS